MYLYPVPWESQQGRQDPGEAHHSPGLGHRAHRPRLDGVDDGVEPLHTHTGEVESRADHREVLFCKHNNATGSARATA